MAGLIHAHINTYLYTIVASAAFSKAAIHTHTLAHNDVSCLLCVLLYCCMCVYIPELCYVFHVHALALVRYIVIPVEQRVTELSALLPRLNPHFGSLCVKNTTHVYYTRLKNMKVQLAAAHLLTLILILTGIVQPRRLLWKRFKIIFTLCLS